MNAHDAIGYALALSFVLVTAGLARLLWVSR